MIEIEQLYKRFGKNEVLKDLSLAFRQKGTISAILGPNGSGKTTLIKSILGMVLPTRGLIRAFGEDIRGRWAYRDKISYLPQIARFPENLRATELFDMVKDLRQRDTRDKALIELFELEEHLQKPLAYLSGGTRQKVNLVLTFMYDNPIYILDEPTAGLDPLSIIRLKQLIRHEKEAGKIVLLTTHIMSLVEDIADEVVFLLDGHIHYRGSIPQLKADYQAPDVEQAIARLLAGEESTEKAFTLNPS